MGHRGCSRSMFLKCAADGVNESHFKSHTEPVLTADKNYRIVRAENSASRRSNLIIGLVLVIMFLLISSWNSMIEPMVLYTLFNEQLEKLLVKELHVESADLLINYIGCRYYKYLIVYFTKHFTLFSREFFYFIQYFKSFLTNLWMML